MSVNITLVGGSVLEGSIFAIDPITESVVLKDSNGGYTLISPSQIGFHIINLYIINIIMLLYYFYLVLFYLYT
jgi:hypothetical protein